MRCAWANSIIVLDGVFGFFVFFFLFVFWVGMWVGPLFAPAVGAGWRLKGLRIQHHI